jgi:N-methylhydantoinase A
VIKSSGIPVERVDVLYELDMHYLGQTHTVAVPLPLTFTESGTGVSRDIIRSAFETAYSASFSRLLDGIPVRVVSLRTAAIGKRPPFDISVFAPARDNSLEKAARGTRQAWFAGGWHDVQIWSRLDLPSGAVIEAPAILEQPDATIVIEPGMRGRVDPLGNVVLEKLP